MNKKNIIANTAMSLILQILNVAIGLVIPRMILRTFGSEMNGLVSSINQFMMYLTLVESGLSQVAVVSLYKPLADKDVSRINHQLSATNFFYKQTAWLYLALLVIMALIYPVVVYQPYNKKFIIVLILVLGLHYFIDFLFIGKYKVLLMADQKQYVLSAIQIATSISFFTCEVILLKQRASIIWVKAVIPFLHLMQFGIIRTYVNKHYRSIHFCEKTKTGLISGRGSAVLHQITGLIMSSTDITLLTLLGVGFKEISVYSVYNTVTAGIISFLNSITNAIVPAFGKALVQENGDIKEYFKKFSSLYYFLVSCIIGPLLLLYTGFVKLYTNNVNDVNYIRNILAVLFSTCFVLNSIKSPYIMLIQSSGLYKETQRATVIEAFVNIVVTIPLIIVWGMNGALVGTICAHGYRYIQLLVFGEKYFSIPIRQNTLTICIYIIVNTLVVMLLHCFWITIDSFKSWMAWVAIAITVTIGFAFLNIIIFYFVDKENLGYYISIVKKRMKRSGSI